MHPKILALRYPIAAIILVGKYYIFRIEIVKYLITILICDDISSKLTRVGAEQDGTPIAIVGLFRHIHIHETDTTEYGETINLNFPITAIDIKKSLTTIVGLRIVSFNRRDMKFRLALISDVEGLTTDRQPNALRFAARCVCRNRQGVQIVVPALFAVLFGSIDIPRADSYGGDGQCAIIYCILHHIARFRLYVLVDCGFVKTAEGQIRFPIGLHIVSIFHQVRSET